MCANDTDCLFEMLSTASICVVRLSGLCDFRNTRISRNRLSLLWKLSAAKPASRRRCASTSR
jgi:hypothetical protein